MLAWCFDHAVSQFGHWVEAKLDEQVEVRKGGKVVGYRPKWRLEQLLGVGLQTVLPSSEQLLAALG